MKLIVCDVEGTIFKSSNVCNNIDYYSTLWQMIPTMLGDAAIQDELDTHHKWSNGEYKNYIDWMIDTINIHKKHKLTQELFETAISSTEYNEGVIEFFSCLDRKKYTPVLISGGFQNLSQRAQEDLQIHHSFSACTYYFKNGILNGYNLIPSDFYGKYSFLQILLNEYGLCDNDWVFVGDGKNDVEIARKAKISFGINPHNKLAEVATYIVKNFMEIKYRLDS